MPASRALRLYVASVTVAGGATLAILLAHLDTRRLAGTPVVWVLAAFLLLGEWAPIRVPWRDGSQEITLSTTFVFAVLLVAGAPFAAASQAVASTLPDAVSRRPWWKIAFNASQYVLAVAAAGGVLGLLGYRPLTHPGAISPSALAAVFVAGWTFYVANNVLVGTAVALYQGFTLLDYLRTDLLFHSATTLVLLSQAPLIVIVGGRGAWLVPMFLPAMAAAYRAARASTQRDRAALHDSLTGLPNRAHFLDRVTRAIADDPKAPFAILLVDADHFREVNDTLGHEIGDRMLQQIAERLAASFDGTGFVARLGGDEFAVLAADADRDSLARLQSLGRASFDEPFDLDGLPFDLDASVGAALHPEHGTDAGTLLRRADVAMHFAKERRSGFETYNGAIDRYDPRRLALLGELSPPLEHGQLVFYYQPPASNAT